MTQVLTDTGSMQRPDNISSERRLLISRRASLIQQAESLAVQRRAILSEVGEIDKYLREEWKDLLYENDGFIYTVSGKLIKQFYNT